MRWGLGMGLGMRVLAVLLAGVGMVRSQGPSTGVNPVDKEMEVAGTLVGKALFLRGFYLTNDLNYDSAGRVQGTPKVGDWTVAAVNVLKSERRGPDEIELDGVRVAIRYNTDTHEFQRHPLND